MAKRTIAILLLICMFFSGCTTESSSGTDNSKTGTVTGTATDTRDPGNTVDTSPTPQNTEGSTNTDILTDTAAPTETPTIKPTITPTPTPVVENQTLRYWVNFPEKGSVITLKAYDFKLSSTENGVCVTAYNKDGSINKESSVSEINTWLCSYEIENGSGKITKKKSSMGKIEDFTLDINVSGGAKSLTSSIKFKGYYKECNNDENIVIYEDQKTSFLVSRSSSKWSYSSEYSKYPNSVMSVDTENPSIKVSVDMKKGNEIKTDYIENTRFVYMPSETVNNGLPTLLINLDSSSSYNTLRTSTNSRDKETWHTGSYAIVEGSSKKYGTIDQQGKLKMKFRGFSSFGMPKKSYTLKLEESSEMIGMKENKDWVLSANYADKTMLRNFLAYTLGKKMDSAYVADCNFIEVYMCSGSSVDYLGTYLLVEKIEVAKEKINISEMVTGDTGIGNVTSFSSEERLLAGSFLVEIETFDRAGLGDFVVNTVYPLNVKSPDKDIMSVDPEFDPLDSNTWPSSHNANENEGFARYIRTFFIVIDEYIRAGDYDSYSKYIDIDSFVDYYIINELAKNIDGNLRLSTYFYKDKGGKMHITIWDFDIAFGNCDYEFNGTYCDSPTGFFIKDNCSWYSSLMANSQFREKVSKRWKELRKGILSDSQIESLISSQASIIKKSAEANDERWNIFGNRTWPNTEEIGRFTSYEQNVEHLINWVKRRADWLDDYL